MEDFRRSVLGLLLQGVVFVVGLVLSLLVGMLLAARTDGPGGLLVATLIAGAGLLAAAVISQIAHDYVVYRASGASS